MARLARIVAVGMPHHVIQRGNRRQPVFFSDSDRQEYLSLLARQGKIFATKIMSCGITLSPPTKLKTILHIMSRQTSTLTIGECCIIVEENIIS